MMAEPTRDDDARPPRATPTRGDAPAPPGKLRRLAARAVAGLWVLALAMWLVGRLVGDRFLVTQYLEWAPTEAIALAGLLAVLGVAVFVGRRRALLGFTGITAGAMLAWLALGQWSLWRVAVPPDGPTAGDARVVFLNISVSSSTADLAPAFDAGADVLVLSNVHPQPVSFEKIYGMPPEAMLERATGITPGTTPPDEVHALSYGHFRVYSRWPIRRRASAAVGRQESWLAGDVIAGGAVLMFEVDPPAAVSARPFVVWAVDMPRTLGASRRELFEEARSRIAGVERVLELDAVGRWVQADRGPDDDLFAPDLVVGDFNTPGHAWSVERFEPSLRPVRADAGAGPAGTWPAVFPLFEIDLARIGPHVRATGVRRFGAPGIYHLGLVVDLALQRQSRRADPVPDQAEKPSGPAERSAP